MKPARIALLSWISASVIKNLSHVWVTLRETLIFPQLIPSTTCVKTVSYVSDRVIHNALPNFLCASIFSRFWKHDYDFCNKQLHKTATKHPCPEKYGSILVLGWIQYVRPIKCHHNHFKDVKQVEENDMWPDHNFTVFDVIWQHVWNFVDFYNC